MQPDDSLSTALAIPRGDGLCCCMPDVVFTVAATTTGEASRKNQVSKAKITMDDGADAGQGKRGEEDEEHKEESEDDADGHDENGKEEDSDDDGDSSQGSEEEPECGHGNDMLGEQEDDEMGDEELRNMREEFHGQRSDEEEEEREAPIGNVRVHQDVHGRGEDAHTAAGTSSVLRRPSTAETQTFWRP
eukprot:747016-Hanusia_phi.AAC.1